MFYYKRILSCVLMIVCALAQSDLSIDKLKKMQEPFSVKNLLENKNSLKSFKSINQNEIQSKLKNLKDVPSNDKILKDVIDSNRKIEAVNSKEDFGIETELSENENTEIELKEFDSKILDVGRPFKKNSSYFGYDIFKSNPDFFQKSNTETLDPTYVIGPGDEIITLLWGETEFQENYIVTKEGYIFIENLGQVFVNGLTLEKLEDKLFKLFSKVYSSMLNLVGNPSTFLDVSLGSLTLRSIRIFVLGEVNQPGAYMIKPNSTLFTSLYFFNGPTIDGSLREIKLIRSNKEISKIDFYDFLLQGKQNNDIRLQRDDVIFIPKRGKTVSLVGEINKPLIFELKQNESIKDLISMAGGLKPTTYMNHAQINRIIPPIQRNKSGIDRTIVDIDLKKIDNQSAISLFNEDQITFFKISDVISNSVTITGAVDRPGDYDFGKGLKVLDLIEKSNGLLGTSFLEKANVTRLNPDNSKDYFEINLAKALNGDEKHNINLKSGDNLQVYDRSGMMYKSDVEISGHVTNPGRAEFKNGMTVADLIFIGGGLQNKDFLNYTFMEKAELRRKVDNSLEKELVFFRLDSVLAGKGIADEKLKMGDQIYIYSMDDVRNRLTQTISVEGFVMRPGEYDLYLGMTLNDLMPQIGGTEDSIIVNKMYFQRVDLFRKNLINNKIEIIRLNLNDDLSKNLVLKAEDRLRFYSKHLFNPSKVISAEGVVNNPGEYSFKENMTIFDLILDAGGLEQGISNFRVDINRSKNLNGFVSKKVITLDLENDFKMIQAGNLENLNEDYFLKPKDLVIVRKMKSMNTVYRVDVGGFVKYPGSYVLKNKNEKISEVIARAGGVIEEAYLKSSYFIRDGKKINLSFEKIINYPKSKTNFTVMDNDSIFIGKKSEVVEIRGEVSSPGFYQYLGKLRFDDYVKMAGGLTNEASNLSSYVINPDGKNEKVRMFRRYPKIYDGSVIFVVKKEKVVSFSPTEYLSTVTAIYADFTQAYLMLKLLSINN